MKQFAGAGLVLAVAVAALRLGTSPQTAVVPSESRPAIRDTTPQKAQHPASRVSAYQGGCSAFDPEDPKAEPDTKRSGVRSVIKQFFGLTESGELNEKSGVRFAIALAPDPHHTNLGLMFDREMVAIEQAAQDEGYNYNSSWLPWRSESSSSEDQKRDGDEASRRESCPGILLFRKSIRDFGADIDAAHLRDSYEEALVVLVVGEQPTGGVNGVQWANAITWLNHNAYFRQGRNPNLLGTLPILGPTFSGSLVSLQRDLAALKSSPGVLEPGAKPVEFFPSSSTNIRILSGSVSRCSTARWFRRSMQLTRTTGPTTFGSFQESDELQIFRFLNYVKEQGTNIRDIAVVSEDETAYANAFAPIVDGGAPTGSGPSDATAACEYPYSRANSPLRLAYPRDISALRSAYEKESLFSPKNGAGSHAVLQEDSDLEGEAADITDTIRSYSGSYTPVAQEAVLYGLVSQLRTHHTRYILLRCTNPLDFLFLTRFFHRAYPEGRIVTVGSDLLFRREIDTTEFRGVLALTTYPLIPRDQHWAHLSARPDDAPPVSHTHRIPESHMEGVYLAARYLFDDDVKETPTTGYKDPLVLPFKENLPDYADPFWMHTPDEALKTTQAPVWVAMVGRDGYWPVAVLNADSTPNNCLEVDSKEMAESNRPNEHGQLKREQGCSPRADPMSVPPSAMVKISGIAANHKDVHYDRDPEALREFDRSLRMDFPLSWEVCAFLASMLLVYQTFGIWRGQLYTSSGVFALFRRVSTPSQAILLGVNCAFALSILLQLLMTGLELPIFRSVLKEPVELSLFTAIWVLFLCLFIRRFLKSSAASDRMALGTFTCTMLFLICCAAVVWFSDAPIRNANRVPLFVRMTHLTQGISPLVPILFLLLGFYLWTWQTLAGNSLLCCGVPMLPELEESIFPSTDNPWWRFWRSVSYFELLGLPTSPSPANGPARLGISFHRISNEMGKRILRVASPLCLDPEVMLLPLFLLAASSLYLFNAGPPLVGLEGQGYAWIVNIALLFAFLLTIAEATRLFFTWKELQRLLIALSRLRLRRTLAKIRAVDGNSLWSVSGSVQRIQFHFFAQQLEAAQRLSQFPGGASTSLATLAELGQQFSRNSADKINVGPRWEMPVIAKPATPQPQVYIRQLLNHATTQVLNGLIRHWATEVDSLSMETSAAEKSDDRGERNVFDMELCKDPIVRTEEEFVCFHYIAFIQNILARMRTMILSMIFLFVSICLAISFYPFVPRNSIGMWMLINLLFIAASVVYVYAGMERDETLSYITNTKPGRLSHEFYVKTASFLAGPVIGLLTTQFPAISESVLSWLQPGLDALK